MTQLLLAVVAGYVVMAALVVIGTVGAVALLVPGGRASMKNSSDAEVPTAYLAANLGLSLGAAIVGGWVSARVAPNTQRGALLGLIAVIAAVSIASHLARVRNAAAAQPHRSQPPWYPRVIAAVSIVGVLLGGLIARG